MVVLPAEVATTRRAGPAWYRQTPVAFKKITINGSGNAVLKAKGRRFYFSKDPRNLYSQDLREGNIVCLVYSDFVVIGRLKGAFRSNGYHLPQEFKALDPRKYMDEIDRIRFLDRQRIVTDNRTYTGDYFDLTTVSGQYGRFEDGGHRYSGVSAMSYGFSTFYLKLSLVPDNRITALAGQGHLLMAGGPLSNSIEFWDTSTDTLLFEIPVNRGRIKNIAGQSVSLAANGTYPLEDFWKEVAVSRDKTLVPITIPIPAGNSVAYSRGVRYSFDNDVFLKQRVMEGQAVLSVLLDRVELEFSLREKYVVCLDAEGYVLGSDGKRFISKRSNNTIQIHRPGINIRAADIQFLPFWEVALKRDKGLFAVAEKVGLPRFEQLIAEGHLSKDQFYVAHLSCLGQNKILLQVNGEALPITNRTLEGHLLHNDVYLVLKQINGDLIISVHDSEDQRQLASFTYVPGINRVLYCSRGAEGFASDYVDTVDRSVGLARYRKGCFFDENLHDGSTIYVSFGPGGIPRVKDTDSQVIAREKIVDKQGNESFVYGKMGWGRVLEKVQGWVIGIPLIRDSAGSGSFAFCGTRVVVSKNNTSTVIDKASGFVDAYGEYGKVGHYRINGRDVFLRTLRDKNGALVEAGVGRLKKGLLLIEPSFVENIGAAIERGALGIKVGGAFCKFFSLGAGAKDLRMSFFRNRRYSAVVQPDGKVIYWTDKPAFDEVDHKIIKAILLLEESPEEFSAKASELGKTPYASRLSAIAGRDHDKLLRALDVFPYQQRLLSRLLDERGKIVLAKAHRRRKIRIYQELEEIAGNLSIPQERLTAEIARYFVEKEFSRLEIAYALRIIRKAANFQFMGHSRRFGILWRQIEAVRSFEGVDQEKVDWAFRSILNDWEGFYG